MAKFLKYNNHYKIINLDSVSNIGTRIDYVNSYPKYKIIFNMSYGVNLRTHNNTTDKIISDYIYWETDDLYTYNHMKTLTLNNIKSTWIDCSVQDDSRFVNPSKISSIVYDINEKEERYKVIFNLNHSVSFKFGGLTSEFVFVKFNTKKEYYEYIKYIDEFVLSK